MKNNKPKKTATSYENLPPPRSQKYVEEQIESEKSVQIGDENYLMRSFYCGAAELVRYDSASNKWVTLCFDKTEDTEDKVISA